jgi:hypothetical protein
MGGREKGKKERKGERGKRKESKKERKKRNHISILNPGLYTEASTRISFYSYCMLGTRFRLCRPEIHCGRA